MIELEHEDIRLTAVHARVRTQVREEQLAIGSPSFAEPSDLAPYVGVAVPLVMAAPVCLLTAPAVGLPGASGQILEREVRDRLE